LANLITVGFHLGRANIPNFMEQLRQLDPNHYILSKNQEFDALFDEALK
jgi:hypothetical protein